MQILLDRTINGNCPICDDPDIQVLSEHVDCDGDIVKHYECLNCHSEWRVTFVARHAHILKNKGE